MATAPTLPGGAVYDLFIGLVPALYFLWQFVQAEGVVWPFWFYAIGVPFAWKPWLVYRRKCPAPSTGHKDVRDRNSRMECCYNACAFLFYVAWLRQTGLTTATILAFLGCVFTTLSSPFFNMINRSGLVVAWLLDLDMAGLFGDFYDCHKQARALKLGSAALVGQLCVLFELSKHVATHGVLNRRSLSSRCSSRCRSGPASCRPCCTPWTAL